MAHCQQLATLRSAVRVRSAIPNLQLNTDPSYADVAATVGSLRYFAGLADKIHGQTMDHFGPGKIAYTLHQPIGVCGQM